MTNAPAWTYQHATELRNHWWWRPGWREGRRFYTWHYTFEGYTELHELVAHYQDILGGFHNVNLVPKRWLHLTVQGLSFVDEIDPERLQLVRKAVDDRLAEVEPTALTFERCVVRPEAIALPPRPLESLWHVKRAIRGGIADILGGRNVPESTDSFQPHISTAYVNTPSDARAIVEAIERTSPTPANITIHLPRLIELHRDGKMYQWRSRP